MLMSSTDICFFLFENHWVLFILPSVPPKFVSTDFTTEFMWMQPNCSSVFFQYPSFLRVSHQWWLSPHSTNVFQWLLSVFPVSEEWDTQGTLWKAGYHLQAVVLCSYKHFTVLQKNRGTENLVCMYLKIVALFIKRQGRAF